MTRNFFKDISWICVSLKNHKISKKNREKEILSKISTPLKKWKGRLGEESFEREEENTLVE